MSRKHSRQPSQGMSSPLLSPTELKASLTIQVPCATHVPIDARWGCDEDPVEEVCRDYKPNVFRKGFCMTCQKRHDVTSDGQVAATKTFVKIHSPATSPHAARAELNPLAQHSELSVALTQAREEALVRLQDRLRTADVLDDLSAQLASLRHEVETAPNSNALESKLQEIEALENQLLTKLPPL